VAEQQKNLVRERSVEAAPRLDRRTDDHELCPSLRGDAVHLLSEATRPGADDLPPHADAVGGGNRCRGLEPLPERHQLPVEVRIERQLAVEHGRGDEHDSGAAVGRKPAGEVDRMLRLGVVEQGDDDRAIRDRARPAREAARTAVKEV
jgi:hypothetical protein